MKPPRFPNANPATALSTFTYRSHLQFPFRVRHGQSPFVGQVREHFLALGCTVGNGHKNQSLHHGHTSGNTREICVVAFFAGNPLVRGFSFQPLRDNGNGDFVWAMTICLPNPKVAEPTKLAAEIGITPFHWTLWAIRVPHEPPYLLGLCTVWHGLLRLFVVGFRFSVNVPPKSCIINRRSLKTDIFEVQPINVARFILDNRKPITY